MRHDEPNTSAANADLFAADPDGLNGLTLRDVGKLFPIKQKRCYFNNASIGAMSLPVIAAVDRFLGKRAGQWTQRLSQLVPGTPIRSSRIVSPGSSAPSVARSPMSRTPPKGWSRSPTACPGRAGRQRHSQPTSSTRPTSIAG